MLDEDLLAHLRGPRLREDGRGSVEEVFIIVPGDVTLDRIGEVLERHWTLEQGYASPRQPHPHRLGPQ
jgi:hypothetical protein